MDSSRSQSSRNRRARSGGAHTIRYYVRSYRFHSVLFRYYVLVFAFFALPLIAAVVGITLYNSRLVREAVDAAYRASFNEICRTFDTAFAGADFQAYRLAGAKSVSDFLQERSWAKPRYGTYLVHNALLQEIVPVPEVFQGRTVVVSFASGVGVSSAGRRTRPGTFGTVAALERGRILGDSWLHRDLGGGDGRERVWSVAPIPRGGGTPVGYVAVSVDAEKLIRHAEDLNRSYGEWIDIVGSDGMILASSRRERIGKPWETSSYGARDEVVAFSAEGFRGLAYYAAISIEEYRSGSRTAVRFTLVASVALILVTIPLAFILAVQMYNPVRELMGIFEEAEVQARPEDSRPSDTLDEYRYITQNISRSLARQEEMRRELARRVAMLDRARAVALQSQINPHFLYNALTTINWLAIDLTKSENEASQAITALSDMLRLTMSNDGNLVTLAEDIEHAKRYVEIQQYRFTDSFVVRWEVEEALLAYKTVKITLQPLIENALQHGIRPTRQRGTIVVTAGEVGETIELHVKDDGVGIDGAAMRRLKRSMNQEYVQESGHIGLANVNQRLRLVFGAQYGISLRRNNGRGLDVGIRMPKLR